MRIFIADDSKILVERLNNIIDEIEGIKVVGQAGEANKIIESVEKLCPDLVILDIRMTGGNGIRVLETLKGKQESPIIIMFTNFPYLQYRKKCLDAGADFFFYKSTEFEKLIDVIKEISKTHI